MKSTHVRIAVRKAVLDGLELDVIASEVGMSATALIRMLRKPMREADERRVLAAIEKLKEENAWI